MLKKCVIIQKKVKTDEDEEEVDSLAVENKNK